MAAFLPQLHFAVVTLVKVFEEENSDRGYLQQHTRILHRLSGHSSSIIILASISRRYERPDKAYLGDDTGGHG